MWGEWGGRNKGGEGRGRGLTRAAVSTSRWYAFMAVVVREGVGVGVVVLSILEGVNSQVIGRKG